MASLDVNSQSLPAAGDHLLNSQEQMPSQMIDGLVDERPSSPVAPPYSPITPKVQPVLPIVSEKQESYLPPSARENSGRLITARGDIHALQADSARIDTQHAPSSLHSPAAPLETFKEPVQHSQQRILSQGGSIKHQQPLQQRQPPNESTSTTEGAPSRKPVILQQVSHVSIPVIAREPEPEYLPVPPSQPFSSEDSVDAIALRAAISALQFQKEKAEADVKRLQEIKTRALADPLLFKDQLVSGALKEDGSSRPTAQASSADAEIDKPETPIGTNARESRNEQGMNSSATADGTTHSPTQFKSSTPAFPSIPGPQNVIRMPYINWNKYHVSGEPLEALHEQQRRWPGSNASDIDRGREHSIASPYSPFYDVLNEPGQHVMGNDTGKREVGDVATSATMSEHPMETRRGGRIP